MTQSTRKKPRKLVGQRNAKIEVKKEKEGKMMTLLPTKNKNKSNQVLKKCVDSVGWYNG